MDVVLAFEPEAAVTLLAKLPGTQGLVIDYQTSEAGTAALEAAVASRSADWSVVHASTVLAEAEQRARREYSTVHATWPSPLAEGGTGFRDHVRWIDGQSLWWFSAASTKDNEADPLFAQLTWIACFRALTQSQSLARCHCAGADPATARLFQRHCDVRGVAFSADVIPARPRSRGLASGVASVAYVIITGLVLAAAGHIVRFLSRPRPGVAAFFALVPETLRPMPDGTVRDRNYASLPAALEDQGRSSGYLAWQWPSLRNVVRLLSLPRRADVAPLAGFLRVRDVVGLARYVGVLRHVVAALRSSALASALTAVDTPVDEPILAAVRDSFFGPDILRNLLVRHAMEAWAVWARCPAFVQFFSQYPIGLATYSGIAAARTATTTVAYQHATYTRGKLWFCYAPNEMAAMPQPSYFVCQGESYASLLSEAGVPANRIIVTGSPRYDALADSLKHPAPNNAPVALRAQQLRAQGQRPVLVATSRSEQDARALIVACVAVARSRPGLCLLFRGHPDLDVESLVRPVVAAAGFTRYEYAAGELHAWLHAVDTVIVSYSTVGDEAVMLRVPVVAYAGMFPSMSSFEDLPILKLARTERDLGARLDEALAGDPASRPSDQAVEAFERHIFSRLDGHATERVAQWLAHVDASEGNRS